MGRAPRGNLLRRWRKGREAAPRDERRHELDCLGKDSGQRSPHPPRLYCHGRQRPRVAHRVQPLAHLSLQPPERGLLLRCLGRRHVARLLPPRSLQPMPHAASRSGTTAHRTSVSLQPPAAPCRPPSRRTGLGRCGRLEGLGRMECRQGTPHAAHGHLRMVPAAHPQRL